MTDFKTELISLLERELPELRDKIQAGAVDERTAVPFAAFSTPDETPVRTILFEQKTSSLEKLKHHVIAALEGQMLTDRRCSLKSSSTDYYPDYDIHGVTLTFRIV